MDETALLALLARDGRPAVLSALKDAGVPLKERQAMANELGRRQRAVHSPQEAPPVALPQPLAAPLCIRAEAGLCNKLRTVLSYREAALDSGRMLIVLWVQDGACPASWEELFEPIDGVTFVYDTGHAIAHALNEALMAHGMTIHAVPSEFGTHPQIAGTEREVRMYGHLRPRPRIARAIAENLERCGTHFAAVHIRRTDYTTTFGLSTADGDFSRFLRTRLVPHGACTAAYVATDNAETQQRFREELGGSCHVLQTIPSFVQALRHTSVADAVVDLYTCAAAEVFKGTLGSSFSDTIMLMRWMRGCAHRSDELEDEYAFKQRTGKHHRADDALGNGMLLRLPLPQPLLLRLCPPAPAPLAPAPSAPAPAPSAAEVCASTIVSPALPQHAGGRCGDDQVDCHRLPCVRPRPDPTGIAWMAEEVLPSSPPLPSAGDDDGDEDGLSLHGVQTAAAMYLDQGLAPPDAPEALCTTHWLPLASGSWPNAPAPARPPRHALEAAVLAVVATAASVTLPPLQGISVGGAEWWLQEQWPDDAPKEHHTDKAVALAASDQDDGVCAPIGSSVQHPLISSVLYLSVSGGPTAVFGQRGNGGSIAPYGDAAGPSPPSEPLPGCAALAFPTPGSLLYFQGDLLHCVLHTPPAPLGVAPTESEPRRTLLINFWATRPPGASDVPLPLPPWPGVGNTLSTVGALCEPRLLQVDAPFARDASSWRQQHLPPALSLSNGCTRPFTCIHYRAARGWEESHATAEEAKLWEECL